MSSNKEIKITVPLEPPSVNHYRKLKVINRMPMWFVTNEARVFMATLEQCSHGLSIRAEEYAVEFCVYQGKGSRGDVDNYSKCVLDGLVHAGVIHSDSAITRLLISKKRDWSNPRTEITIRVAGQQQLFEVPVAVEAQF